MLSSASEAVARMAGLGAYVQFDAPMLSAHLSREEAPEIMAKLIRKHRIHSSPHSQVEIFALVLISNAQKRP